MGDASFRNVRIDTISVYRRRCKCKAPAEKRLQGRLMTGIAWVRPLGEMPRQVGMMFSPQQAERVPFRPAKKMLSALLTPAADRAILSTSTI